MSALAFSARSRSAFTTASGARETKASFASFLFWASSWARAFSSSFSILARSFSRSTSSAMGMSTRAEDVVTVTMPFALSSASLPAPEMPRTSTSLAEARRLRYFAPAR